MWQQTRWLSYRQLAASLLLGLCTLGHSQAAEKVLRITTFGTTGALEQQALDRLQPAYARLGYRLELVSLPGARALASSNAGETDGELVRKAGIEVQFPNLLRVPTPVSDVRHVIFARREQEAPAQLDWKSLREQRFAYERGTRVIEENVFGFPGAVPENTVHAAMQQLQRRRVDLVIADQRAGLAAAQELGLQDDIKFFEPPLADIPLYHYLHKRHAALLAPLDDLLRKPAP